MFFINLNNLRESIDEIDQKISHLLKERNFLVNEIAKNKKSDNINIYDKIREDNVIKKVNSIFNFNYINFIYKTIMDTSKHAQLQYLLNEDINIIEKNYKFSFKIHTEDIFRFFLQVNLFNIILDECHIIKKEDCYIVDIYISNDCESKNIKGLLIILNNMFYFYE